MITYGQRRVFLVGWTSTILAGLPSPALLGVGFAADIGPVDVLRALQGRRPESGAVLGNQHEGGEAGEAIRPFRSRCNNPTTDQCLSATKNYNPEARERTRAICRSSSREGRAVRFGATRPRRLASEVRRR